MSKPGGVERPSGKPAAPSGDGMGPPEARIQRQATPLELRQPEEMSAAVQRSPIVVVGYGDRTGMVQSTKPLPATSPLFGAVRTAAAPPAAAADAIRAAVDAFAARLELVPAAEIAARLGDRSVGELVAMARDAAGRLEPIFHAGRFDSVRANLPEVGFGGSGWEPARVPAILGLRPEQHPKVEPNLNATTAVLPPSLRRALRSGTLVTSGQETVGGSELQLLVHTAPKRGGATGGRTGMLLHNGLPVVIRDRQSGKEFVVELKGAGSVAGGYQKDEPRESLMGGQVGGEWTIIGGVIGKQGRREDQVANELAFSVLRKPEEAVLSMGYVAFDGAFGPQALNLRMTPGNNRLTYVIPGHERTSQMVSRAARQASSLLLQSILAGFVPMTHPENFVFHPDDPALHMTDFADNLPIHRFPVHWGFTLRDFRSTVDASLRSVEQIPGFDERQHLADVKAGFLEALGARGSLELLAALEAAPNLGALIGVIRERLILKLEIDSELEHGRLPEWVLTGSRSTAARLPYARETLDKEVWDACRYRLGGEARSIDELQRYPKSASADSFPHHTDQIRDAVLLGIVYDHLRDDLLSPKAVYTPQLERLFEKILAADPAQPDLVWARVKDRLQGNTYAADLQKALTTTPEQAADRVRRYLRSYVWADGQRHAVISVLEREAAHIAQAAARSALAQQSVTEAERRIAELQAMTPDEFAERYLQSAGVLYPLMFLPYHQPAKLRQSAHANDPNVRQVLDDIGA